MLNSIEARVLDAARVYASALADAEHWRTHDAYPYERHQAATYTVHRKALPALLAAARALETRPTGPTETSNVA